MMSKCIVIVIGALFLFLQTAQGHIKHIITDLGGVIIQDAHLQKNKLSDDDRPPKSAIKAIAWGDWMRGQLSTHELIEKTANYFERRHVESLVAEALTPQRPMIAETVAALKKLKKAGYKLYVLSNLSRDAYTILVENNPFFTLFDGLVFSFQEGFIKPEPAVYELVLARYRLNPHECLFIDDKPVNIAAARRLGINGFVYRPGTLERELKRYLKGFK